MGHCVVQYGVRDDSDTDDRLESREDVRERPMPDISTINCGNNTTVNQTYPPSTVETTQQSIKISTINCGNNTTVDQTYPPSIVETTQYKGQSGFLFHHALLSFVCQTDTSTKQFQQFLSLKNTKTTTTTTKNKQTKKREQKLPWGWGHVKKQSSAK